MLAAASIQDYFNPGKYLWQGPLLLILLAGWVVGGAFLLRQKLKSQEKLRKRRLPWYMLVLLLSAFAAMALGGVVTFLFNVIGKAMDSPSVTVVGLSIGSVIAIVTILLVIYAMTDLPFGVAAKSAVVPLAAGLGLGVAIGIACFWPVRGIRVFEGHRNVCEFNMKTVARSLQFYQTIYDGMPPTLDVLVSAAKLDARCLKCPGAPAQQASYFYLPVPTPNANASASQSQVQVQACDFLRNHDAKGRNVLLTTGTVRWYDEDEFQKLLLKPENADFAKALIIVEAGGQLPAARLPLSSAPASRAAK